MPWIKMDKGLCKESRRTHICVLDEEGQYVVNSLDILNKISQGALHRRPRVGQALNVE